MRFSVWPGPLGGVADAMAVVGHCDAAGWQGAYVMDHFMLDTPDGSAESSPVPEALTLLAAMAARTERIRLGALVLGNAYRHPAVVAKAAVTLDEISGGRAVVGLGAGWQLNEHRAYGIELAEVRTRMDRFEEAALVIRSLIHEERTTFAGRHYQLSDAPCEPTPPEGRLPLLIGAKGPRRGLRIAALAADEWNSWATVDQLRTRRTLLDRHCEDLGRDPDEIRSSTQAFVHLVDDPAEARHIRDRPSERPRLVGSTDEVLAQLADYAEAGLDELIVPDWEPRPLSQRLDALDRIWVELAVPLGAGAG